MVPAAAATLIEGVGEVGPSEDPSNTEQRSCGVENWLMEERLGEERKVDEAKLGKLGRVVCSSSKSSPS